MAKLFQGEVMAKAVPDSLMTERKASGKISVSMMLKVEAGEKADDDKGRQTEVGGSTLSAYLTVTEKTRARVIESLEHCGLSNEVATRVIETAEGGQCGSVKAAAKFGFGSQPVQLVCEIDTYGDKKSTKVQWINSATGGRRRNVDAPEVDLGLPLPKSNVNSNAGAAKQRAPWETK